MSLHLYWHIQKLSLQKHLFTIYLLPLINTVSLYLFPPTFPEITFDPFQWVHTPYNSADSSVTLRITADIKGLLPSLQWTKQLNIIVALSQTLSANYLRPSSAERKIIKISLESSSANPNIYVCKYIELWDDNSDLHRNSFGQVIYRYEEGRENTSHSPRFPVVQPLPVRIDRDPGDGNSHGTLSAPSYKHQCLCGWQ